MRRKARSGTRGKTGNFDGKVLSQMVFHARFRASFIAVTDVRKR